MYLNQYMAILIILLVLLLDTVRASDPIQLDVPESKLSAQIPISRNGGCTQEQAPHQDPFTPCSLVTENFENYQGSEVTKKEQKQNFYVITAIFNPASFQRRFELYHQFVTHMEETGAHLITIECIFPSLGQRQFQVTNSNNSNHIQIKSDSLYWVKENLINIAVAHLPASAEWVAWIDADVVFEEKDWIQRTIHSLEKYSIVQLFKYSHFLDENEDILLTEYSFGYFVATGKPIGYLNGQTDPHPGYGWAMSKSTFLAMGGLPLYDIVGMGDLFFAYSLVNNVPLVIDDKFNFQYKNSIIKEVHRVYNVLTSIIKQENKEGILGFSPLILSHKWHGARKDRGYMDRVGILIHHNFNYWTDMKIRNNGLLVFKTKDVELETDIGCYFESRNEDSEASISLSTKCKGYKAKYANQTKSVQTMYFHYGFNSVIELAMFLISILTVISLNEKLALKMSSQIILVVAWLYVLGYPLLNCKL